MKQILFEPTFDAWQQAARAALRSGLPPAEVIWRETGAEPALDLFEPASAVESLKESESASLIRVPKQFLASAQLTARHSDAAKWPLLYRILWRLSRAEPRLLDNPVDPDTVTLRQLEREVNRDAYRMRQYIRFRETQLDGNPWFVAWYEPDHDSVDLNAGFFRDRFANLRWSILTPKRCLHWDGEEIRLSAGVERSAAPQSDDLEPLWIAYYSNIFNPARVKVQAMKAQMPVRNWKNLPEAAAIPSLLAQAPLRVHTMIDRSESQRVRESDYSLARPPITPDWTVLRDASATCKSCPLWKNATCTVFGEGPLDAQVVLVGEQPGDAEDRAGKPFVGPAGQVLDRALAQAGLDRSQFYVTNAVKHFKWEPRGKRRIHQTPGSRDIVSCRPWLEAELNLVAPRLIVALGGTAARSLFGVPIRITEERGRVLDSEFGSTLVTIHPSALLRLPVGADPDAEFERFVSDLQAVTGYNSS